MEPFEVTYRHPEPLESRHGLNDFECQSDEQTSWLRRHALQAVATGTAKVFVVTEHNDNAVVAYYAWSMASIGAEESPSRLLKGAGRYPQPVALLARLGVDNGHTGHGLGAGLLQDVMARTAEISTDIGCRGLLVHAETEQARNFYLYLVPEFEPSPTDELHLVLLIKDIKAAIRTGPP